MDPGGRWGGYKQQLAVSNVLSPGRRRANRLKDKHILTAGGRWVPGAAEPICPMSHRRVSGFTHGANG